MIDYKSSFEMKLAYHTAPSLYGIKSSSLLKVKKDEYADYLKSKTFYDLKSKDIQTRILFEENNEYLILVYNKAMLEKNINEKERKEFLLKYGYEDCVETEDYLKKLSSRFIDSSVFPHEIGIFLGYPVEDVDGFIKNEGRNCKMVGFWKVYSDTEKANRLFKTYRQCRQYLCSKISDGVYLCDALGLN